MTLRNIGILTALAACAGANANLLTNGSFELGSGTDATDWTLTPTAIAATVAAYQGIGATGTSPYGARFLDFNGGNTAPIGSATQDFGTTTLGTTYVVSFAYGQYGGMVGDQTLNVTINATSVPAVALQTYTNIAPSTDFGTIFKRASFTFVGTGLPTGITFTDAGTTNTFSTDLFVDDVSVQAVPEPATMAVLGLGALGLLRKKRRA